MHLKFKDFLEKLGIHRVMSAYETQPWYHYEEDQGITCSAEVRIGPDCKTLQAEVQFVYDEPEEGQPEQEQIMIMGAQVVSGELWAPQSLFVKGEDYVNKFGGWDKKACNFFTACVQAIQMGELPDIDKLLKDELSDDDEGGGRRGRIGRKSPKANPAALLGMKKGM